MPKERAGYEEGVGKYRAKAASGDPEQDANPMVQELIARLRFADEQVPMAHKSVLDYGCGTGLAVKWVAAHTMPRKVVGVDISPGAIEFARAQYPGFDFRVESIEDIPQDARQEFDYALCFEVLEHLNDPDRALQHLACRYLSPQGTLVSSTPNRAVFSAGTEPSPINRTHIHEMLFDEYIGLLDRHFAENKVWGMRFHSSVRQRAFRRMVKYSCGGLRFWGEWWWNPFVRRMHLWMLHGEAWHLIRGTQFRHWTAGDFEFISNTDEIQRNAIWFFSVSGSPRSGLTRSAAVVGHE